MFTFVKTAVVAIALVVSASTPANAGDCATASECLSQYHLVPLGENEPGCDWKDVIRYWKTPGHVARWAPNKKYVWFYVVRTGTDQVPANFVPAIIAASEAWAEATTDHLHVPVLKYTDDESKADVKIIAIYQLPEFDPRAAMTCMHVDANDHFLGSECPSSTGTIKFNLDIYSQGTWNPATYCDNESHGVEFWNTVFGSMLHEFGHVLGLGDDYPYSPETDFDPDCTNSQTIMRNNGSQGQCYLPFALDVEALAQLYPDDPAASVSYFGVYDGTATWNVDSFFKTDRFVIEGANSLNDTWAPLPIPTPRHVGVSHVSVGRAYRYFRLVEIEKDGRRKICGSSAAHSKAPLPSPNVSTRSDAPMTLEESRDAFESAKQRGLSSGTRRAMPASPGDPGIVIYCNQVLLNVVQTTLAAFWTSAGYNVTVKSTAALPTDPDAFRNALHDDIVAEAATGDGVFLLVGDANDYVEFGPLSPWKGAGLGFEDDAWEDDVKQDSYLHPDPDPDGTFPYPPDGQPEKNTIPIWTTWEREPRDVGMSYYAPYWFSDQPYADVDGDNLPDVSVGRLPFTTEDEVLRYATKLWNNSTSWNATKATFLIGKTIHSVGEAQATADAIIGSLPTWVARTSHTILLDAAGANSQTAAWINTETPELIVGVAEVSGRYNPCGAFYKDHTPYWNMNLITTSQAFVMLASSCGVADFVRTENRGAPILQDFLATASKGAVAWIGPAAGTWQTGNEAVAKYIVEELYGNPSRPMGESFRVAIRRVITDFSATRPEIVQTARSYVFLGDPMVPFRVVWPVSITAPVGTPAWYIGTQASISWQPNPSIPVSSWHVQIDEYNFGSAAWQPIYGQSVGASTNTLQWTVSSSFAGGANARVTVSAKNAAGQVIATQEATASIAPFASITNPTWGWPVAENSSLNIAWNVATGYTVTGQELWQSYDAGTTWYRVDNGSISTTARQYPWTTPSFPYGNAKMKLVVYGPGFPGGWTAFIGDWILGTLGPPPPKHGTIVYNTKWSGGQTLNGDVKVAAGATLTLQAGTQIGIAPNPSATFDIVGYNDSKVDLICEGTLNATGTISQTVSAHSSGVPYHEGDWGGVYAVNGCTVNLQYMEIRDAQTGVSSLKTAPNSASGTTTLNHCTLSHNSNRDVHVSGDGNAVSVLNSTIDVASNWGIYVESGSASSSFTIQGNTLTGTSGSLGGIMVDDSNMADGEALVPVINGNTLSGFTSANGYSVQLKQGNTIFKGNDVRSGNVGIYITAGSPVIGVANLGNQLSGLQTAIYVKCTKNGSCPNGCGISVTARYNDIVNNVKGVLVEKTTAINLGTSSAYGFNNLYGNTTCIQNQTGCSPIVSAVGNYWNPSCAAPACNVPSSGAVDVSHALCQQPTQGGPHLPPAMPISGQQPGPIPVVQPSTTALVDIHPNPFNPITTISYDLRSSVGTEISIYNVSGQLVRKVDLGRPAIGRNSWTWDGRDQHGGSVSSGVYFVVLKAGNVTDRKKAVLLK